LGRAYGTLLDRKVRHGYSQAAVLCCFISAPKFVIGVCMSKVMVVVPTFNEAENLEKLAAELLALPVPGLEMLVVDDNSPDGTGKMADGLAAQSEGRIHVLHRSGKQGLGTAYIAGFKWAIDHEADIILQMDADFSHSPSYIPQMVAKLDECDAVIGSRYIQGGRLDERWSFGRRLLSWWANSVWVRGILRTSVHDNTGGFRAWRRTTLVGMNLDRVRSNGYIFQVEITYIALRLVYKFCEVPIYFADRKYGKSKMGLKIQIEAALRVFEVWWRHHALNPVQRAATS
jgi:dolichol-phosphate mannosyltransferase